MNNGITHYSKALHQYTAEYTRRNRAYYPLEKISVGDAILFGDIFKYMWNHLFPVMRKNGKYLFTGEYIMRNIGFTEKYRCESALPVV